jgi:hypothetical protein
MLESFKPLDLPGEGEAGKSVQYFVAKRPQ